MKKSICFLLIFLLLLPLFCFPVAPVGAAPAVSAKSAILIEAESGKVLYLKNAFERLPMASTTKIMTAIVAIESGNLSREVTVSPSATGIEGSSVYLYPEEKLTMEALIYALLLESANDAATAIAIEVAGSTDAFAAKMNEKAEELGLLNTHFSNPHGLDDSEHYTSAYDLARIAAYALSNETFRSICSTYRKTIPLNSNEGVRILVNHNKMLKLYKGAIGVKTGFTKKSGRCLVSAATRDGLTLIAVTLSAPNDWNDHTAMLDFGFSHYEKITLCEAGGFHSSLSVVGGTTGYVGITNTEPLAVMLARSHGEVVTRVEMPRFLYAPVGKGDKVGRLIYEYGGEEIAACDLIATETVDSVQKKRSLLDWFKSFFGLNESGKASSS